MVVLWMVALAHGSEDDTCAARHRVPALAAAISSAQNAFANLDLKGFEASRDSVLEMVPCMEEVLTNSTAAGYHRVRALDAFLRRAEGDMRQNVSAVVAADPTYRLPTSLAPKGHPVRLAHEEALAQQQPEVETLPVPENATLWVNGTYTLDLPVDRPVLVQYEVANAVRWTRVIEVGETVPAYDAAPDGLRQAYLEKSSIVVKPARKPIELPIITGLLGAGALGLYAYTHSTSARFDDPTTPPEELDGLRKVNNAMNLGAGALGLVAVGAGTWTVITW